MPQLYLLAVEACRLLGLGGTPQVYVKSSSEAAAYYLLLPSSARLHGLNGGAAPPSGAAAGAPAGAGAGAAGAAGGTPAQPSPPSTASSDGSQGARGLTLHAISSGPEPGSGGSTARSAVAAVEGRDWQCAVVLTSALLDLLEPAELQAVMAGCLAFHAALTSPAGAGLAPGGEATQLAVLCRSMAALASLGALAALCPEALLQRLPPAMAPFFASRIQPVLRRCLRYLALFGDRVAAAALGGWRPVAAAAVKQAAGAAVLRDELNLDAVLEQARALEGAAASLLPQALLREEAATVAGAGASLALLRVRELQKWSCGAGGAAAQ